MLTLRSHINRCPECSAELESLRELKSGLSALPMCEPRKDLAEDILREIRTAEPASPARRFSFGVMVATSVAAATLAFLVFNTFFGTTTEQNLVEDGTEFDSSTDYYISNPGIDSHAPLVHADGPRSQGR